MDEKEYQKALDKHVRKIRACLKRLQINSDSLKELLTPVELQELAAGLATWDKHVSSKINK